MQLSRSSGVLLHPTSLPSRYGIGDLGGPARYFLDRLAEARQTWWQMLPLNPPGYGGSPYSATSAFAGNIYLIDLDDLVRWGWLTQVEVDSLAERCGGLPEDRLVMDVVFPAKRALLEKAFERWQADAKGTKKEFQEFCRSEGWWLEEYALFASLKAENEDKEWREWRKDLIQREKQSLHNAKKRHTNRMEAERFFQWLFFKQWEALHQEAKKRGIKLIGDIPIFVAMDSSDAWALRDLFRLDKSGRPDVVAGVPPDYFSKLGQKWGNPLYRWDVHQKTQYQWWIARIKKSLELTDLLRIDHFRGFDEFWAIPAEKPDARIGQWWRGPGDDFFHAIRKAFGDIACIAEDLGDITASVLALRDRHRLPGMKILQFAFDGNPDHPFLPHTYPEHCVAYTGTHDNDTSQGWYNELDGMGRHHVRLYLSHPDQGIVWRMIEVLLQSRAALTVFPMQDLLELDTSARMNVPGTTKDNWLWRLTTAQIQRRDVWEKFGQITGRAGRG